MAKKGSSAKRLMNGLFGVTKAKREFAKTTGIPTTKSGMKAKLVRETKKALSGDKK